MRAFSLLETIMYVGLFALIMEGAFAGIYAISESADRDQTRAYLEEEGDFILDKIAYELSQASTVTVPDKDATNTSIRLIENGEPVSIQAASAAFSIIRDSDDAVPFSSNLVHVQDVSISLATATRSVSVSFSLQTNDARGRIISEDFFMISYPGL